MSDLGTRAGRRTSAAASKVACNRQCEPGHGQVCLRGHRVAIVLTVPMFVARAVRRQAVLLAMGVIALSVTVATAPQRTVFRSTVDVIAVDVQVVDRDGNPIERIRPEAFEVSINGQRRKVQSAQFLRHAVDPVARHSVGQTGEALSDTEVREAEGRRSCSRSIPAASRSAPSVRRSRGHTVSFSISIPAIASGSSSTRGARRSRRRGAYAADRQPGSRNRAEGSAALALRSAAVGDRRHRFPIDNAEFVSDRLAHSRRGTRSATGHGSMLQELARECPSESRLSGEDLRGGHRPGHSARAPGPGKPQRARCAPERPLGASGSARPSCSVSAGIVVSNRPEGIRMQGPCRSLRWGRPLPARMPRNTRSTSNPRRRRRRTVGAEGACRLEVRAARPSELAQATG